MLRAIAMCTFKPAVMSSIMLFYIGGYAAAADNGQSTVSSDAQRRRQYQPVIDRLKAEYSLERVARNHIEVGWDDLVGMATPLSQIVPVEERYHPERVYVQADMSVALGMSVGVGFAVGSPARLPDYNKVTRRLLKGYLPIVQSRWTSGDIGVSQTAFGYLPNDEVVVAGKETQYVAIRMVLANRSDVNRQTCLVAMVCPKLGGAQTMGYASYRAPAARWRQPSANIKFADNALEMDGKALLVCRCDKSVKTSYHASMPNAKGGELQPDKLTNCLNFDIGLGPRETRTIDFVVAGAAGLYPLSEFNGMRKATFESALARVESHWAKALEPATKITTPDQRLNDLYRQTILSNLQQMIKLPDRPWRLPTQTPTAGYDVWPWEAACTMIPMISIGYRRECEPSIDYFTQRQIYVGPYSEDEKPQWNNLPARPDGDLKSVKGAYIGWNPHWMNETGSVLWIMSQYYRYSHDKGWLERNRPSILAAWDFIRKARNQTKTLDDKGRKVRYYGLLPKGRPSDVDGKQYHFCFSDNYTWKGMSEMAKAFAEAGLSESKQMTADANDYRQCILDVVDREQFVDPDTKLVFIPNTVFYKDGVENRGGVWHFETNLLFQTGLLSVFDKRFDDMVSYMDRKIGFLMGLCGRWDSTSPFWYTGINELCFYNAYLERAEYEKALLTFYSNAVYGFSNDTYQGVERIDVGDPGYCPLQPNASANGRYIEMLRRMVIDEQDADSGKLWLLRGCPRRWFDGERSIEVANAITMFGAFNMKTASEKNTIKVYIDGPRVNMPHELLIAVRHPQRKTASRVLVNGEAAAMKDEIVRIISPKSKTEIICQY